MPFQLNSSSCFVVFQDPNVGEFQYEIKGTTLLPEQQEEIRY